MELTLKIDQRKKEAKALIEYLNNLPFVVIESKIGLSKPNQKPLVKSPYNAKFVAMVKKRIETEKFTPINTKSIWESIK